MILNPAIIALLLGSLLLSLFALHASTVGWQIIRHWDIRSGSELQLVLERKTYLVSTVLAYLMCFQLFSFFLFIYTADTLHELFIGAMCAAGVLNVNPYGYPTLMAKILNVVLCGVWLGMNDVDNQAWDYPLIRPKYKFLILLTGSLLLETYLQLRYFTALRADVIASCCGTLFSAGSETLTGDLASIPSRVGRSIFWGGFLGLAGAAVHFLKKGRGAKAFSLLSIGFFIIGIVSLIAFISVTYYELPTHHCPFCVLQRDYHFIGYPMYLTLLGGVIFGGGVGLMQPYRGIASLQDTVARTQRAWCRLAMISYLVYVLIALTPIIFSDFRLEGY
jgi:hypothetical protein